RRSEDVVPEFYRFWLSGISWDVPSQQFVLSLSLMAALDGCGGV
ncbi:hypothetical protein A2U01_0064486, partial [Trifolium medium]|nr:hypothetical protein [Trifolium medium]